MLTGDFSVVRVATGRDQVKSSVKIVKRDHTDESGLRHLDNQTRLYEKVKSPNVVKLHWVYKEKDAIYMTFEACHGEFNGTPDSPLYRPA